jgi:hypothetical protein
MNNNSNGEVYGSKALNLSVIGLSVLILAGMFWQPAPVHARSAAVKRAAAVEQVVVTAHRANPISG